jgi:RNA-binding motif protein, X-linked 2
MVGGGRGGALLRSAAGPAVEEGRPKRAVEQAQRQGKPRERGWCRGEELLAAITVRGEREGEGRGREREGRKRREKRREEEREEEEKRDRKGEKEKGRERGREGEGESGREGERERGREGERERGRESDWGGVDPFWGGAILRSAPG